MTDFGPIAVTDSPFVVEITRLKFVATLLDRLGETGLKIDLKIRQRNPVLRSLGSGQRRFDFGQIEFNRRCKLRCI